jgi:hypothetical protein
MDPFTGRTAVRTLELVQKTIETEVVQFNTKKKKN